MTPPIVVYTDPVWALSTGPEESTVDPELATIEREVFDGRVDLRFGPVHQGRYRTEGPEQRERVAGAAALGIYRTQVTPELLDAAGPQLRVVARQGVGTDNLNVPLLRERGLIGFNIPDYCIDEVAAHTVGMVLAWERGLIEQHTALTGGRFDIHHGPIPRRLANLTVGVIGLGRIGKAVAARLRLFYGRILATDPYLHADHLTGYGVSKVELPELLAESDVVLLHCPLAEDTRGMIDAAALRAMRPGALLVNTARGGLVDGDALYQAVRDGGIAGAALDVFTPEDPHQNPAYAKLLELDRVLVTSHRAFLSAESEASSRRRVAEGIQRVLETGQPPVVGTLTHSVNGAA